ncbi:hypothetical protein V8D89_001934 [Ganoderma adspersum]
MSSENTEPVPVPPPATDAPATIEPTPAATTAAVVSEVEPTPAAAAPEPTPAPVAEATAKPEDPKPAEPSVVAVLDKKEEDEPQNELTKKFTEDEWKAVKELRAQLPSVFEKAYPDIKPTPSSITLWGVELSTTPSAKGSVILAKFVRARTLVVSDAADMLAATLKWRAEIDIDAIMQEEFDQDLFGRLGKVYGKDKDGRPIAWNLYGEVKDMKAVFGDTQKFIRWRVQFMEQSIEFLDFETIDQMVQIHDYEGVSMTSRDAAQKAAAKEATTVFQNYYPEFLSRKFFINVPTLLTWVFWLFKPLISAATLAKMAVVGTGAKTIGLELSQVIDVKELPKRYGGEAEDF